jgi:hypothetical protein
LKHVDQKEILYHQKQELNFDRDTLKYKNIKKPKKKQQSLMYLNETQEYV